VSTSWPQNWRGAIPAINLYCKGLSHIDKSVDIVRCMMLFPPALASEDPAANAHSHNALGYVSDAFAEALLDGVDGANFAYAALYTAFRELVGLYGEEAVAKFATELPDHIRAGQFSIRRPN